MTTVTDREAWLQARRAGIGSSDAPAVCGVSPWRGPHAVWLDKTGRLPLEGGDSKATRRGRAAEATVAQLFTEETGIAVTRSGVLEVDAARPWMVATPDYFETADGGLVECKTTRRWTGARSWDEDLPDEVLIQVLHQLHVTGRAHAWAVCWVVDDDDVRIAHVEPDRYTSVVEAMLATEERFWHDHVLEDRPPPVDATPGTARAIDVAYADARPGTVELDADAQAALVEWIRHERELGPLNKRVSEAKKARDAARLRLLAALGELDTGAVDGQVLVTATTRPRKGYTVEPGSSRSLKVLPAAALVLGVADVRY